MTSPQRNATLDLLRLLGAAGIVTFHMQGPYADLGYIALPFFIALSIALTSGPDRARGRAARLLIVWLQWSGIYAILKAGQAGLTGRPIAEEFEPWMLATGPAIHLWFLPYMAAGILLTGVALRLAGARGMAILGFVVLFCGVGLSDRFDTTPWAEWTFGLSALGIGLVLCASRQGAPLAAEIAALGVLIAAAILTRSSGLQVGCAAAILLALALRLPRLAPSSVSVAAPYALGVYLVHPAIIALASMVIPEDIAVSGGPIVLTVVAMSFLAAWFMGRFAPLRSMVAA